ncbi:hypothetical protein [Streptomyces sp. MMG1533]|uniref:hypothetical protein n=1 Tax=Streptomyces sp. MMG1533 TaxID=1415546 RepID=UPI000A94E7AF|nr:hypothetical protein [Streptomyces sp. MMG1533]
MGRLVRAGMAAGAALLLAACGGGELRVDGGAAASGGGKKTTDAKTASLAQSGSLTVAFCHEIPDGDSDSPVYGLTLRSYSTKNGAVLAERSTVLPSQVEPRTVCEKESYRSLSSLAFNKDLSLVAGITEAGANDRAAAYDLATGKEISPPDPDAFTERPENASAVFHPTTGRLWYGEQNGDYGSSSADGFGSRDARKGYSTEERIAASGVSDVLHQDAATTLTALAAQRITGPVTPSAQILAHSADYIESGPTLELSRVSQTGGHGDTGVGGYLEDVTTKGLDSVSGCEPVFWRDDTNLVCDFKQITFTSDYTEAVKTQDLIPANDRANQNPVLSADGKSFAFLSEGEGDQLSLFRADFASGATAQPVKVADVEMPLDGSEDHHITLVRWN